MADTRSIDDIILENLLRGITTTEVESLDLLGEHIGITITVHHGSGPDDTVTTDGFPSGDLILL